MGVLGVAAVCVFILILVKTGSLGKAIGFAMRYLFFPIIFGVIGLFIFSFPGCLIGVILGTVLAFKNGKDKLT